MRSITPAYAVSPQIAPEDIPAIAAAGIRTLICNRPDIEVPPALRAASMQAAAEAAGLTFVVNPVLPGDFTADNVARQHAALDQAEGPVLAYCQSGTRSTIVWLLLMAGTAPVDELMAKAGRAGYQLDHLRPMIEAASRG
ncbi:TIGR01244 family sulfur transferase [Tropicimonas sp. IMCC34043]|uniref:TIGR01244 family sulfur transferase n=1 Tax=Tropicimonas sp. IMCC34043 TaxID=2248760 RepID=UPI0035155448